MVPRIKGRVNIVRRREKRVYSRGEVNWPAGITDGLPPLLPFPALSRKYEGTCPLQGWGKCSRVAHRFRRDYNRSSAILVALESIRNLRKCLGRNRCGRSLILTLFF